MATVKQKLAAKKIIENHGNVSKTMVEVGYTPATAINPSNLTESKGWNELMERYLPDDEVLIEHQKGLHATKPIGALVMVKKDGEKEVVYKDNEGVIEVDDTMTRLKAVELAYKVKGKMGGGDGNKPPAVQINFNANKYVKER